jgi:hypothetical protein
LLFGSELVGQGFWLDQLAGLINMPNRFEQGPQLVIQRWNNLVSETAIAAVICSFSVAVLFAFRRRLFPVKVMLILLLVIYLGDVWRINDKFMFLIRVPENSRGVVTPVSEFLAKQSNQYRTLPMDATDPMFYVTQSIPVLFTSNPVQKKRWQEFLDAYVLSSPMSDIMNVRYLVVTPKQYAEEKTQLASRFEPVFNSPDGKQVVLENKKVLPKAWLVSSAFKADNSLQILQILQSPDFDPRKIALIETPTPINLDKSSVDTLNDVLVDIYQGERIKVTATAKVNSLLVLGEKYYKGWKATVDGNTATIYPVNYILRGVYLTPGKHTVEFLFDPLPYKIGKYLTLVSLVLFAWMIIREWLFRRNKRLLEG